METLECNACKKQSHVFAVMSDLQLSLPEPKELGLEIVVHVLPKRITSLLTGRDYDPNASEQPVQVFMKVAREATVEIVISKLQSMQTVGCFRSREPDILELVLYSVSSDGVIRGILDPKEQL
jgi:hypothetical protein